MAAKKRRSLEEAIEEAETVLHEKDRLREDALRDAREIQRAASGVLRAGVPGDNNGVKAALEQLAVASAHSRALKRRLEGHPELYESGFLETPMQELAEAYILIAQARGESFPAFEEIAVTPAAYLLGAADAIGEFRRRLMDAVRQGRIADAEADLAAMERAFNALSGISLPDAIVPLRKKIDTARALLERSRGELALAVRMHEHEKAIRHATKSSSRRAGR